MKRQMRVLVTASAALLSAACAERITGLNSSPLLDAAFTSTPLSFDGVSSSYSSTDGSARFLPGDGHGRGERGRSGLPGGHDFMGGGLGLDFVGGPDGGRRPFDFVRDSGNCIFASGVISCAGVTRDGITTTRTYVLKTAAGAVQSAFDSATNSVTSHVTAAGTFTRRDSATTTVSHVSDRVVTGLAKGSTLRTVDGASSGTESSTGRDSAGTFSVKRVIGDTTSGLKIPVDGGRPTYPTAGTVVRSMTAVLTSANGTSRSSTRREVISYDGSATASLVITRDGTTKRCSVPLPRGRPDCN